MNIMMGITMFTRHPGHACPQRRADLTGHSEISPTRPGRTSWSNRRAGPPVRVRHAPDVPATPHRHHRRLAVTGSAPTGLAAPQGTVAAAEQGRQDNPDGNPYAVLRRLTTLPL